MFHYWVAQQWTAWPVDRKKMIHIRSMYEPLTHQPTYICMYACIRTHVQSHKHTHTHTHTHVRTYISELCSFFQLLLQDIPLCFGCLKLHLQCHPLLPQLVQLSSILHQLRCCHDNRQQHRDKLSTEAYVHGELNTVTCTCTIQCKEKIYVRTVSMSCRMYVTCAAST